jgi:hypothetical protein
MPVDEHSEKDRPGKVFVGGLTPNINEQDLEKQFRCGKLPLANLPNASVK